MYKILISYNKEHNLWKEYGTITTTSSNTTSEIMVSATSFKVFETDDIEVLKEELLKLDSIFGFDQIKVIQDVTANYSVDIDIDNLSESEDEKTMDEEDV